MQVRFEQSETAKSAATATLYIKYRRYDAYPATPAGGPARFVGVYAARLEPRGLLFWGWRWTTNPEALAAAAIEDAMEELLVLEDRPTPNIILPSIGLKKYFQDFIFSWEARGGLNSLGNKPDDYELWKGAILKYMIGGAQFTTAQGAVDRRKLQSLERVLDAVMPRAVPMLVGNPDAEPRGWHGDQGDFDAWCLSTPECSDPQSGTL